MSPALIQKELKRSLQSLQAAENLLEDGLLADTISRAYYAVLHAAKAALLKVDVSTRSHRGVIREFSKHFILTNKIEIEYGEILKKAKEDRELSDYDVWGEFEIEQAKTRVEEAKRFVNKIHEFLEISAK